MKIDYEFIPDGNIPTYANSIMNYTELYLSQLCSVLMLASIGSPTHIDFLLTSKIHPYSMFKRIASNPDKLKLKLNMVNSITKAYICSDNGNVLIRFVDAKDDNVNVHVRISLSDLLQAMRKLKGATL